MLRLCVALGILAAVVWGQWPIPLSGSLLPALSSPFSKFSSLRPLYGAKPKRTSSSVPDTVVWLAECSPRQAFVSRGQDAQLQCEAVVSAGTEVIWYKNHQLLLRQQELLMRQLQQETYEEASNEVDIPPVPATTTSTTRLHISSVIYIDCADDSDEAEYSLEIRTPTNNVHFRNFSVHLVDMRQEGSTCNMQASQLQRLPRIYYHAPRAWPMAGDSLILPCRAQGSNLEYTWYVDNTYVGNTNPNYQVLPIGDLVIRTVGVHAPTRYRCRVSSTDGSGPTDDITTTIRVHSQ